MRFERFPRFCGWLLAASVLLLTSAVLFAQETTGGLQGTVKDTSGAVVGHAHVVVKSSALAGDKELESEANGYYRFANLPPGVYNIEVSAKGFKTAKREGLTLEVGHLPTVDIVLEVGTAGEVVEVTGQAPAIDVTTNTNQTNITQETLDDVPHGYSFQSVIQYAPMARNEPLAGGMAGAGPGGNGGSLPGSSGNGFSAGFSVGGAGDSENTYLVEGQDTENISGGASQANVPFQFIQEVQVKTSGIEAEHGGALGGERLLSPRTVALMTLNHLPDGRELADMSRSLFSEAAYAGIGFGLGFAVVLDRARTMTPGNVGEYFWGGAASTAFWIDPKDDLAVVFMTQFLPSTTYPIRQQLRTLVYAAMEN